MEINYEAYKIFYAVAIHGSISKAADALYISQPAITKCIQKLESELEITLFNRSPKGVTLTENGKVFFDFIKNGVESFMNGEHKLSSLKNLDSGVIKIGASATVTKYFLLPFIEKFHNLYPNIDISITNHLTHTLISLLKNGSLDLLIVNLPTESDNTLQITPCCTLNDCFAGNIKYKNQINKKISIGELVENEELAGRRASSREDEAAQPRLAQALLGWSRVRLQDGRAPALLRGSIWQSCWHEAALPWVSLATTCLAARFPALDLAGFARLGNATGAFLASAPLLPCLYTKAPGVLTEGLGAGGLHTVKGNDSESSVRGKGRTPAGLLQRLLGRQDSAPHEEHQAPRAPGWGLQPRTPGG